jgi:excisionase family DNA binding protein
MEGILSVNQVAKKLGVSPGAVYRYIRSGKLKAFKLGGKETRRHWRIKEIDLHEFIGG